MPTFTSAGGTLTGPLYLAQNPVNSLEAVPKQYIDSSLSVLDASVLIQQDVVVDRLPGFIGDASGDSGTGIINLVDLAITPGQYTKPTTDNKGRVIHGESLTENDLPDLSYSKITTGIPDTLETYGITDALSTTGGDMTGPIILNSDPVDQMSAATKQYVDAQLSGVTNAEVVTGDIIRKAYLYSSNEYLRCNGAYVNKTSYPELYNVIGNKYDPFNASSLSYINYNSIGSGQPWSNQYDINTTQTTDITTWTTGTALPVALHSFSVLVTKNLVYIIGGHNGTVAQSSVYYAVINADGTLGTWTTGTALPVTVAQSHSIVTKNRVYLLSGSINGQNSTASYTAPINSDGTLGAWTTGTSLPVNVKLSKFLVTKNRVYLIGGLSINSNSDVVYTAPINTDGTLGTWTTGIPLPVPISYSQCIVTNNRVYILGGNISGIWLPFIYTAVIDENGVLGDWSTAPPLPFTFLYSNVFVTRNIAYLLGGQINSTFSAATYKANIDSNGIIGPFTVSTSLPGAIGKSGVFAVKNKLYIVGGDTGTAASSVVYIGTINFNINDYSPYYNGTINLYDGSNPNSNLTPSSVFALPNSTEYVSGLYHYIKT